MESGDVCLVAEEEQWHFTQGDAVASVDGDDLYACDALEPNYFTSESTIARMRRSTGETTWTDTPCGRIVRVGEQIGVVGPNSETLSVYQDFDAMALDTPAFQTSGIGTGRLIELEQVLFGVAFSGVSRTQLPSGAPLAPISLEGGPSIDGFSSALNSLVIYDDDAEALLRFDPSDGTLLETLPMDVGPFWSLESMVCFDAA